MKKVLGAFLVLLMAAATVAAEDIDVFSDCDNAIPPNVLVLFDTSLSMRNQDVYDDVILEYSHDKTDWSDSMPYAEPYEMMYKEDADILFWTLFGYGDPWDEIQCGKAKDALREKGYFEGELCLSSMECKGICTDKLVVTKNYLNYMDYVEKEMTRISFGRGQATGEPGFDLSHYCPGTDYYNYYGDGMGYGDYSVPYGSYSAEEDRAYVKMGMTRPYNSVVHPGGIKVQDIDCEPVRTGLLADGWAKGKLWEAGDSSCIPGLLQWAAFTKLLMTKNFLNYLDMKRSRRYNGIDALYNVIQNRHNDINFGIMQFDMEKYFKNEVIDGLSKWSVWDSDGGDLVAPCGSSLTTLKQRLYTHYQETDQQYGQPLMFGHQGVLIGDSSKDTPLAESLIEAGLYFAGQPSWFNNYTIPEGFFSTNRPLHDGTTAGNRYMSPIECDKQDNHVIIITDGAPSDDFAVVDPSFPDEDAIKTWHFRTYTETGAETSDEDSIIGDYDNDSEACTRIFGACFDTKFKQTWVDDVAAFLFDKDLSPLDGKQSIQTNVISFRMDADAPQANQELLYKTAKNGHGMYAVTRNKDELEQALELFLGGVVQVSTFSSAVTPVRQDDLTYSGNETLLTTFHLSTGKRGEGNVKKYEREGGVIKGLSGGARVPLLGGDPDVVVKDLWSQGGEDDGNAETPSEGVAGVLHKRIAGVSIQENSDWSAKLNMVAKERTIYGVKVIGGKGKNARYQVKDLRHLATGANPEITIPKADGAYYRDHRLKQFLAEDVYGLHQNWPLGHIVHSNVVVAHYPKPGAGREVYPIMFVGANDGMLHCFDMDSGQEKWALVPPDQNDRLYLLENILDHPWFIDGEMVLYHEIETTEENNRVIQKTRVPTTLIFGERRGGSAYHIVDVSRTTETARSAPGYVAMVGGTTGWGQSWSKPRLCQVKVAGEGEPKKGFLVGGGYDTNQDLETPAADEKGRFVGIYDLTGETIQEISRYNDWLGAPTDIKACIVGARIIDHDHDAKRTFSRIYAGDLEGHVYHFSDELKKDTDGLWVTKTFDEMDGLFGQRHLLFKAHYLQDDDPGAPSKLIKQKIFYAPMYGTACDLNMVYAGTGDREKPSDTSVTNSLYAIKERWEGEPLERDDLVHFKIENRLVDGGIFEEYTETGVDPSGNPVTPMTDFGSSMGWYFDFDCDEKGEKVISEISVIGSLLVFGTYTPPASIPNTRDDGGDVTSVNDRCSSSNACKTGQGRVYIVNACPWNFEVRSIKTGGEDPMPQPAIIFDKDTGKILISTGDGGVYDPDLPVVEPEYWKSSTTEH